MSGEEDILAIDASMLPVPLLSAQSIVKMYDPEKSISDIAKLIGCDRAQLSRWLTNGLLLHEAEKLAQKIGVHPSNVWGPEYHIAVYMMEILNEFRRQQKLVRRKSKKKDRNAKEEIPTSAG